MCTWAELHHGLIVVREANAEDSRLRKHLVEDGYEAMSARVYRRRGSPRTKYQEAFAAVADAGGGAVLAGASAAWLWQLPGFDFVRPVELTRARDAARRLSPELGVVHERRRLPAAHTTTVATIPTLTLPVLLYQLAATCPRFERVADTVVGRSPAVLRAMHDLLPEMAAKGRNGITAMRAYLDVRPAGARVPTGLERRFETIVAEAGMRPFERQIDVGGHEWTGRVDYLDRELRLIVEIQSATYHDSFLDRAADEARVGDLLAAGFRGVLMLPERLVWYARDDAVAAVRLARRALVAPSPEPFVAEICALGAQISATERDGRDASGRMSA